jgi:hypothetical protein
MFGGNEPPFYQSAAPSPNSDAGRLQPATLAAAGFHDPRLQAQLASAELQILTTFARSGPVHGRIRERSARTDAEPGVSRELAPVERRPARLKANNSGVMLAGHRINGNQRMGENGRGRRIALVMLLTISASLSPGWARSFCHSGSAPKLRHRRSRDVRSSKASM